jgi:ubiquinone/menaquinone biosynthesis C-methylase UbiE
MPALLALNKTRHTNKLSLDPLGRIEEGNVVIELGSDSAETIAAPPNYADVVTSSSMINSASNREQLFKEIFRVLKPYGRFYISDLVLRRELPGNLAYSGHLLENEKYLELIEASGFMAVRIKEEEFIETNERLAKEFFSEEEINIYGMNNIELSRITVMAEKSCCGPVAIICRVEC